MTPVLKINTWLDKEKELSSANPDRVILATASKQSIHHILMKRNSHD